MKKTIQIKSLLDKVNNMLLHSPDNWKERRIGASIMLSDILHESGAYKGYNNLTSRDMERSENGSTFGVLPYDPSNPKADRYDKEGLDDSRRVYFHA